MTTADATPPIRDERFIIDKVCTHCGKKMMRGALICPACRKRTDRTEEVQPENIGFAMSAMFLIFAALACVGIGIIVWGMYDVISWWDTPAPVPKLTPEELARHQSNIAAGMCFNYWMQKTGGEATHGDPAASLPDANGVVMVTIGGQFPNTPYDLSANCYVKDDKIIKFQFTDLNWMNWQGPDAAGLQEYLYHQSKH